MKILFVASIYPPDIGGPSSYVSNLVKELDIRGYITKVLIYRNFLPFKLLFYFFNTIRYGKKIDIIYAHGGLTTTLPSLLAAYFIRKKIGIKITGDYIWEQLTNLKLIKDDIDVFQSKKYNVLITFLKFVQSFVVKRADFIITPSAYLKNIVIGWGANEEKINLIYNAINAGNFINKKEKNEAPIIISIGRLVSWKGFDYLIRAFSGLYHRFPESKLVIIGDGPLMSYLRNLAAKSSAKNSIIFTGALNKEKINDWYNKADCFVLFSGYEGLSHVILEALLFNLPVIASKKGGNVELIENGTNGILVDWPNEINLKESLLSFLEKRDRFVSNPGLADKDKFSWDYMVDKTTSVFEKYEKE